MYSGRGLSGIGQHWPSGTGVPGGGAGSSAGKGRRTQRSNHRAGAATSGVQTGGEPFS